MPIEFYCLGQQKGISRHQLARRGTTGIRDTQFLLPCSSSSGGTTLFESDHDAESFSVPWSCRKMKGMRTMVHGAVGLPSGIGVEVRDVVAYGGLGVDGLATI